MRRNISRHDTWNVAVFFRMIDIYEVSEFLILIVLQVFTLANNNRKWNLRKEQQRQLFADLL